jgi:hypothetical protein
MTPEDRLAEAAKQLRLVEGHYRDETVPTETQAETAGNIADLVENLETSLIALRSWSQDDRVEVAGGVEE